MAETNGRNPVILAVETSTAGGGAAIAVGDVVVAERYQYSRKTHSERLLPAVRGVMSEAQIEMADIDAVAVTRGPGAFTAVRVGLSTAKGICAALGKPLVMCSTLESLAAGAGMSRGNICVMLDARKNQVYTAMFRPDLELQTLAPERVCHPKEVIAQIKEETLFVGDGALMFWDLIAGSLGAKANLAPAHQHYPRPSVAALIGVNLFRAGKFTLPAAATPVYLRPSDAEINYARRKGRRPDCQSL